MGLIKNLRFPFSTVWLNKGQTTPLPFPLCGGVKGKQTKNYVLTYVSKQTKHFSPSTVSLREG